MSTPESQTVVLPPWSSELIDAQIEITIRKDSEIGLLFDLDLKAKSHLWLVHVPDNTQDGQWFAHMRYGEVRKIKSFLDLQYAALDGRHGRGFINERWAELLISLGHSLEEY